MYKLIIDLLNNFLNYIHIPGTPLNPDVFQGVFVKKLSNQNIIKEKRRISANNTILKVNQTHIDVTGEQAKLFFFEGLSNTRPELHMHKKSVQLFRNIYFKRHSLSSTTVSDFSFSGCPEWFIAVIVRNPTSSTTTDQKPAVL